MFKQLKVYYVLISLPFLLLIIGSTAFFDGIKSTIIRNPHPQINFAIFGIIMFGGIFVIVNARRLVREARNLAKFSEAIRIKKDSATLQTIASSFTGDLACILQMVASSGDRSISHQEQAALENELSNARARLIRRNALPQYLTGLLVGMGLLGTFIGLLATLNDITVLISSFADLDMNNVSPLVVFRTMIDRMKAPMQSMGIAFSASMFGLLGSIVLGLMMVGIRRLQGDIFSLLSSEVARHIETALSYESLTLKGTNLPNGDPSIKVLLRIEERLAESSRLKQRTLSSEIDDFKKQRGDMLRALNEQTEANNNFRSELQSLGRQLSAIFNGMEKRNTDIADQVSDLTVHLTSTARETHKLLSSQIEEQRHLKETLDGYKLDERLSQALTIRQQTLSSEVDVVTKLRNEIIHLVKAQTEINGSVRNELKNLSLQLGTIAHLLETGKGGLSSQVSELTSHLTAEAKESRKLLSIQTDEQKKLRDTLDSYNIEERLTEALKMQKRVISSEITDFQNQRADMLRTLNEQTVASNNFRCELQQLGRQLDIISNIMESGNGELSSQVSEMMIRMAADAKEAQTLLAMQVDEQKKLCERLDLFTYKPLKKEAPFLRLRESGSKD